MGAISRLEAINHMLEASGESLVADLDGSSGVDTAFAEQILDRYERDYQLRGLSVNQYTVELYPDANGRIFLPVADDDDNGIIDAELFSMHTNDRGLAIYARVQGRVQPKLYNVTDDTDIWEAAAHIARDDKKREHKQAHEMAPEVKGLLEDIKRTQRIFQRGKDSMRLGKMGPEHAPYIATQLRKLANWLNRWADELDEFREKMVNESSNRT